MHFYLSLVLISLLVLMPVHARELIWKENIKPLTLKSSYTKFNDFFLYDETKESESWAKFSLSSELAQEGDGWGYTSSLHAYHSLSSIKHTSSNTFEDKGVIFNFVPAFYLSAEQRLYLDLNFQSRALLSGEGVTQFLNIDQQVTESTKKVELTWRYGSELSPRYFDVRLGYSDISYDTELLALNRAEYKSYYAESELGFAYTTASHLLLSLSYRQDRYTFDSRRDADYINSLVGVSWNPSQATNLRFLIGYFNRRFEQQGLEDSKGLSWKLSATWNPVDRFSVLLNSSRNSVATQDPEALDSVLTSFLIEATYEMNDRVAFLLGIESRDEEFNNAANVSVREIDDTLLKAEVSYEFKKSWLLALAYTSKNKEDNQDIATYDQSSWTLSVQKEY